VASILRSGRFWPLIQAGAGVVVFALAVTGVALQSEPQASDGISVDCVVLGGREVRVLLGGEGAGATISVGPSGEILVAGEPCFDARVSTVDRLVVVAGPGHQAVTLDLAGGPFAPGDTPEPDAGEVEIEVGLGLGDDRVTIKGGEAPAGIVVGGSGINLNASPQADPTLPVVDPVDRTVPDADLRLRDVELLEVRAGEGPDVVSGAGGEGTGSPYPMGIAVDAGLGDDTVVGGTGDDTLLGGDGADSLEGAPGDDEVLGLEGTDSVDGGDGSDLLDGGQGDDSMVGGLGDDEERGGEDDDTFVQELADGSDALLGGPGTDAADYRSRGARVRLSPDGTADDGEEGEEDDVGPDVEDLVGGSAGDILVGNAGANTLAGGPGDDVLRGETGDDVLMGGPGLDLADYSTAGGSVEVDLGRRRALDERGGRDDLHGVEAGLGGPMVDVLRGNRGPNLLRGGPGDDHLDGRAGDDLILGGRGNDDLLGGDGGDVLTGEEADDLLDGGAGTDVADYADAPAGIEADLAEDEAPDDGHGGTDQFREIEEIAGTDFADDLRGGPGGDVLRGRSGDDTLAGRGGDDELYGGPGTDGADYGGAEAGVDVDLSAGKASDDGDDASDTLGGIEEVIGSSAADVIRGDGEANTLSGGAGEDVLTGGGGDDALSGGDGVDTLSYEDSRAGVTVNLRRGLAPDDGGGGTDSLVGLERVVGSAFDDALVGDSFANVIRGGQGADRIAGGVGGDRLEGGPDEDDLDGGPGTDTCVGGEAVDGFDRCEVEMQ
jgi:Ca2+-binding RTX toxin-like protein